MVIPDPFALDGVSDFGAVEVLDLLASLSLPERELLHGVCSFVYWPHNEAPPAVLVPYARSFRIVFDALPDGWEDVRYSDLVSRADALVESAGWGEFGWGFLQRLCMFVASPAPFPADVLDGLLVPLRLVSSVPVEWAPAVLEALPALGLDRALSLPPLVGV